MEKIEQITTRQDAGKIAGPTGLAKSAEQIADNMWRMTATWNDFAKVTMGVPLMRAMDEVGTQLRLMMGRTAVRQHLQFIETARRSLIPADYYLQQARRRGLAEAAPVEQLRNQLMEFAQGLDLHGQSIINLANQKIAERKQVNKAKSEQAGNNSESKKDATVAH